MHQAISLEDYLHPIEGKGADYDPILSATADAQLVLIGEATHGTHEFYHRRAEITKRLIREQGFNAVAIEADWPDTYRINHYVRNDPTIHTALEALYGFKRFPSWMWRNSVVMEFIEWLRHHNSAIDEPQKVGVYGIDLYSLTTSIKVVLDYLHQVDNGAAARAEQRYSCFKPFQTHLQNYGYAVMFGEVKSCESAVTTQLAELSQSADFIKSNDYALEEFFNIQQNARLIKSAEKYYRSMSSSHVSAWNVRDTYMAETVEYLIDHLTTQLKQPAKLIIWAHNSHIGDARATESGHQGQINIGQLLKQKYKKAVLIGFLTHSGTVTAASKWEGPAECKTLRPALHNSYEYFFHHCSVPTFMMCLYQHEIIKKYVPSNLLQRAIGVLYLPYTERTSHYFCTDLNKQFDIIIYIDHTTALAPLETTAIGQEGEVCETYPSGL